MPITWAYKRCNHAVFLPVDYSYYSLISNRVMEILRKYCEKIEVAGIDEAYLDFSEKNINEVIKTGKKIQNEIKAKEKITCSIGIGPNKLIAKIASDYKKPEGLTIISEVNKDRFLENLDVKKLYGIGPKTSKKLNLLGIMKVRDLKNFRKEILIKKFGENFAEYLLDISNGIDNRVLEENYERKSVGRMITFLKDSSDKDFILKKFDSIIDELYEYNLNFKTLTVIIRYSDFSTFSKQKTYFYNSKEEIKKIGRQLLKQYLNNKKVRLIGASFSNFYTQDKSQQKLFLL